MFWNRTPEERIRKVKKRIEKQKKYIAMLKRITVKAEDRLKLLEEEKILYETINDFSTK